jgi:transposase
MVRNEEKYQLATHYRKRGFSYTEIAHLCGVSKGTISNWLAKKAFSKKVKQANTVRAAAGNSRRIKLLNRAKVKERTKQIEAILKTARVEYRHYRLQPHFVAGLLVYASAGDRSLKSHIRLASTRTTPHVVMHSFAKHFLGVDRTDCHFWLLLSPLQTESSCIKHWNQVLKLKPEQWYKNQVVETQTTKPPLHFGVGNTIIGNTVLKQKLDLWVELALKELK